MKGLTLLSNKKLAILIISFMMVFSFSPTSTISEPEQVEKTVKVGIIGDPESLNPITAFSGDAWTLINWLHEPLVRWDLTGGTWTPVPGLAESWQMAPNGTQMVFNIVQNATWHDGTPITAHDVNWTLFTWTWLGWWRASTPLIDHYNITVIDDHTIAVNFVTLGYPDLPIGIPDAPFWGYRCNVYPNICYNGTSTQINEEAFLMALPYMPILPKHIWDPLMWNDPVFGTNGSFYWDAGWSFWDYFNYDGISWRVLDLRIEGGPFIEPRVGGGPWKFVSWTHDDKLVFEANDNYHWGRPNIDKIEVSIWSDVTTATAAVETGTIDFTETSPEHLVYGDYGNEITLNTNDFMGFNGLFINQHFPYLNKTDVDPAFPDFEARPGPKHLALLEPAVKKAIHQVIDKDRINTLAYLSTAEVTDSVVVKSLPWYNDQLITFPLNATEAMNTLLADGWFMNADNVWEKNVTGASVNETLEFDIKYSTGSDTDRSIATLITEDLATAGIKVTPKGVDPTTFVSDITRCWVWQPTGCWNFDMMVTFLTQTGDPHYLNMYMTEANIVNLNGINQSRINEIFAEQRTTLDDAARGLLMDEFQQVMYNDSSVIPLVLYKDIEIYRADKWEFTSGNVQSGLYSLYNTFAFREVDEAPPPSPTSTPITTTTEGVTITSEVTTVITSEGEVITTVVPTTIVSEIPASANGFTFLLFLFSFVTAIFMTIRKRRK
ncbi:MAG: ABC transporter substrate-binding protein [Candidatus Kariarchaeaceae archaeon]|jgi:ABC-type transport system substrate-binding protein